MSVAQLLQKLYCFMMKTQKQLAQYIAISSINHQLLLGANDDDVRYFFNFVFVQERLSIVELFSPQALWGG